MINPYFVGAAFGFFAGIAGAYVVSDTTKQVVKMAAVSGGAYVVYKVLKKA